jgi:zinc transporter ZupT
MNYIALIASVLVGYLVVVLLKPKGKSTQLLLSFSGAYLLSTTVLHLLPEVFETHQENIGIYILAGILLQTVLEYFSKGVEHGHVHIHGNLHKIPWLLFLSLYIHAFVEGIPLANKESSTLLWAIVVHKIPISIVLVAFLLKSDFLKKYALLLIAFFALMSPLGTFLSQEIQFFANYQHVITAVVIGVFLHIATAILFETSENHQFSLKKFVVVLFGFAVAMLSTYALGH